MKRNMLRLPWAIAFLVACTSLYSRADLEVISAGKYPIVPKWQRKAKGRAEEPPAKREERKLFTEERPFNEVVKEMQVEKGLFTFYRKPEENKVFIEIQPEQFGRTFLFAGSIEQSVGERGLYSSQMGGQFPFQFKLVGKTVQWIVLNTTFTARKDTPAERATQRSFPNSILGSARILAQPHPERKSILINAAELLLTDIPGLAPALREAFRPSDYRFDRGNSAITGVKAFPENVLFEVWLNFASENPRVSAVAVPDERSIPILVKYDFSALKETDYKPRLADDRIGNFVALQEDLTSDRASSPYVRRIQRWNLRKKDPASALSEPVQPIVFWLENTIPVEYRPWVKEGALLWNKAFERIGFKDAIVVKQQPDDADWDAADTRYNTIRWFAGVDATFAIGPSRANPYTGEIYDADIGLSEGLIRSMRRNGEEFIAPIFPLSAQPAKLPRLAWDHDGANTLCAYGAGLAQEAAFGVSVLSARGVFTPEMEERLMHEFVVEVTAHEVGHTLGLRHNFRASTMLKPEQLLDDALTEKAGQSGSVMDYNPIVIAPKGEKQGHFVPVTLGPYDYWAIKYAYKPFAENEEAELKKIARRAAEPDLAYSTDEDALGPLSANAMDPLVNQFDQSSDPLRFFGERIAIINELWSSMGSRLVHKGEGYQILRRAVERSLGEYYRALMTASKFIGGLYLHRDHAGDPNGRPPFEPVSAARQNQALEFLRQYCFSEEAFRLPPNVYNLLAPERLPGLGGVDGLVTAARVDTPWHDSVLELQRAVLTRLHASATLSRLEDNELRVAQGQQVFGMVDLFSGLESAIWAELDKHVSRISSLRRNLQREHLKTLSRLALHGDSTIPEDATSLARATLVGLKVKIDATLKDPRFTDASSRAHLEECRARIRAVLEARMAREAE